MAFCLVASAQVVSCAEKIQSVGGDFGRTWLENLQAQNPNPTAQDSEDKDWLGVTTTLGNESNPKNNTTSEAAKKIPFTISKTFSPIHEIDASFNQTLQVPQLPQPDKNGLINGLPAETYYAIGPAFFDF